MAVPAQRVSPAHDRIEAVIADDFAVISTAAAPPSWGQSMPASCVTPTATSAAPRALYDPPNSVLDVHRRYVAGTPRIQERGRTEFMVVSRQLNLDGWGVVRSGVRAQHVT